MESQMIETLSIRLTKTSKEKLKKIAHKQNQSITKCIENMIEKNIEENSHAYRPRKVNQLASPDVLGFKES